MIIRNYATMAELQQLDSATVIQIFSPISNSDVFSAYASGDHSAVICQKLRDFLGKSNINPALYSTDEKMNDLVYFITASIVRAPKF